MEFVNKELCEVKERVGENTRGREVLPIQWVEDKMNIALSILGLEKIILKEMK